jgi:hypothetical protein
MCYSILSKISSIDMMSLFVTMEVLQYRRIVENMKYTDNQTTGYYEESNKQTR